MASENWKIIDSEQTNKIESENQGNNALKMAKTAVQHLQKLTQAIRSKADQSTFLKCAKSALSSLNSILIFAKQKNLLDEEQNLRELTHQLLVSAKESYQSVTKEMGLNPLPINAVVESIGSAIKQLLINSNVTTQSSLNLNKELLQKSSGIFPSSKKKTKKNSFSLF